MNDLAEHAAHEFRLSRLGQDGVSLRDTLAVIAKRTGVMPAEGVNPVALPPECAQVWQWFLLLSRERPVSDMGGARPLTSAHVLAWMALEQVQLEGWEVAAIWRLDEVALASWAEDRQQRERTQKKKAGQA